MNKTPPRDTQSCGSRGSLYCRYFTIMMTVKKVAKMIISVFRHDSVTTTINEERSSSCEYLCWLFFCTHAQWITMTICPSVTIAGEYALPLKILRWLFLINVVFHFDNFSLCFWFDPTHDNDSITTDVKLNIIVYYS